jgi:soluble lytic murein transglycosylase
VTGRHLAVLARLGLGFVLLTGGEDFHASAQTAATPAAPTKSSASKSSTAKKKQSAPRKRAAVSRHTPHRAQLREAFIASTELRPMAQQLATFRSPEAYAGVLHYAQTHTGEAAAAAYLALGHAYYQDKRDEDAVHAFQRADQLTTELNDYAVYLEALALEQGNHSDQALALLSGYSAKFPESIFNGNLPIIIARMQVEASQPQAALTTLRAATGLAGRADYIYLKARALQITGDNVGAAQLYRHIYKTLPLTAEAKQSQQQLTALPATGVVLTAEDQHVHADDLYAAHRYAEAEAEYLALDKHPDVSAQLRNDLRLDAAACAFKLKRLSKAMLQNLPDTQDDHGAERLYLLMEDARTRADTEAQRSIVAQMEKRFPQSQWLEEALYSSGNMYFLKKDYPSAIDFFQQLLRFFPHSSYAAYSHWKTAWLNYRMGNYAVAGRLFDEQIAGYSGGTEFPDALYWRGRVLEDFDHQPARAKAYYQALSNAYHNYYFGDLARQRLNGLSNVTAESVPLVAGVHAVHPKPLSDHVPEDDVHVIRARLLGNAGLNEYIAQEIHLSPESADWAQYAELQIYAQAGETYRALQVAKRITPSYYAVPVDSIPPNYWKVLFPLPYWQEVRANSEKNGLDPYLVLSLMRQESEFNPSVVSYANAYGLMQLLPSTGKSMAHAAGLHPFATGDLLNPPVNIQLGTLYLKQTLDKFHGQVEYALAAYNAGDDRIQDWLATGNYKDVPEFVESIPFTQTRDYVQAILRNEGMYKRLNGVAVE